MTEPLIEPEMVSALAMPATQIFLDTLDWHNGLAYLWRESLLRQLLPAISIFLGAGVLAWFDWTNRRRLGKSERGMLMLLCVLCTYVGMTKWCQILPHSSADEGCVLYEAKAGQTNDYSCVIVKATGLDPAPMWYRAAVSNEWTLATDDGWTETSVDRTGDFYTREWRNPDTNTAVTAWAMWYFGQNPPAVELTVTGGVKVVGAMFSGRTVRFTWMVDENVALKEGSRLVIQNLDYADSGNPSAWNEIVTDESPSTNLTMTTISGFYLDRKTKWRLRLEVPQ
jgi:hypothetical protein